MVPETRRTGEDPVAIAPVRGRRLTTGPDSLTRHEEDKVNWLRTIEMGPFVIIVGTISVLGWIILDGTVPLVSSIIAGSLIALKGSLR